MKSEFILAFNEIAETRKLPREVILEALRAALVSAYRRAVGASPSQAVEARIDERSGNPSIWAEKEVVDEAEHELTEVSLEEARRTNPDAQLGDLVFAECTPPANFGRIAAQTAKQVILQRMREAEREAQYAEYQERVGDLVTGTVQSSSGGVVTIGLGRTEAILPRNQQVPGEKYRTHDKVRAYVMEVKRTSRGPQIVVSRTHRSMLRRLLEYEVPEIYNGAVEIKSIAREPGARSKVAVAAIQEGADPVGACVGMRGVRIQSIVKELNGEKIDVIEWSPDQSVFISKALSPARVSAVFLDDDPDEGRTAIVVVPDDQLSLAIGREGQNARLAAKLTGWRIDIKSVTEAAGESWQHAEAEADLAQLRGQIPEMFEQVRYILDKKAASKPIMPEDYQTLIQFVTKVENYRLGLREEDRTTRRARREQAREQIPARAYHHPLDDTDLPLRIYNALAESGFATVGEIMEMYYLNPNRLLNIQGVGQSGLAEVEKLIDSFGFEEAPAEDAAQPEAETMVEAEAPAAEEAAVEAGEVAEALAGDAEQTEAEQDREWVDEEDLARQQRAALVARMMAANPPQDTAPAEAVAEPEEAQLAGQEQAPPRGGEVPVKEAVETGLAEAEEDVEEEDDELAEASRGKKSKDKRRRTLEFDENLGKVVSKRKRKPGRARDDWEDYVD